MNTQQQAAYPPKIRKKWYFLVDKAGKTVDEVCALYFISRKTYYKWRKKDVYDGVRYTPRKTHPHTKITREVASFIKETKQKTNYGPEKMRLAVKRELGVVLSGTAIYRFFKKYKLIKRPQKKLPWYEPMKKKLMVKNKGEGVQLDVKYIYDKGVRQYQFSVFDPYTKCYHFSIFPTRHSRHAVSALKRAEAYFGFKTQSVQTDNGSEFRGDFHVWCTKHNLPHYFIPKKSPWWNANVERVHKTIDDEFYHNPDRYWKNVTEWLEYYNTERIHLSLGGLTPREKLLGVSVTP